MPVRAGNAYGSLPSSAILNSINYACANGADVVNGSFGGSGKSTAVGNAIKSNACKNTLFVFAAGNDGRVLTNNTDATNAYPCEYWRPAPHGVGATNLDLRRRDEHERRAGELLQPRQVGGAPRRAGRRHLQQPARSGRASSRTTSRRTSTTGRAPATRYAPPGSGNGRALAARATFSMTDSPGGLYPNNADIIDPQPDRR